ncbi:hypothetical protein MARI151_30504 [Maribacter litoralis]|uniref:Uncharacterized protein n=1 Tax=Maribacter litoralis TaxID=2059726 RepID=A0A653T206_9FLAO|nr:hypothetical protein MARI151_30504 [Maribacter litoralis]
MAKSSFFGFTKITKFFFAWFFYDKGECTFHNVMVLYLYL